MKVLFVSLEHETRFGASDLDLFSVGLHVPKPFQNSPPTDGTGLSSEFNVPVPKEALQVLLSCYFLLNCVCVCVLGLLLLSYKTWL